MKLYTFFCLLLLSCMGYGQDNIGIGTTTPHNSAALDITANSKGLLIPRLTLAQRPSNPAVGLVYFQTDGAIGFYYWDGLFWKYINPNVFTPAGIIWQIPFYSSSNTISSSNNFIWDDINLRLGVGTNTPQRNFHLKGSANLFALEGSDHVYQEFYPQGFASGRKAYFGFGLPNSSNLSIVNEANNGNIILKSNGTGNIGIGIDNPSTTLHVDGIITAINGNSTQWDSAYKWGNHALAGYVTNVDGSETKVSAGANIVVAGNGTTTNPYIINTKLYTIGQEYEGGYIVYLDQTGLHGLVAAPRRPLMSWSGTPTSYFGSISNGIYAGSMNTSIIVSKQDAAAASNSAAFLCYTCITINNQGSYIAGYHLPSITEMQLIRESSIAFPGLVTSLGLDFTNLYWTSNENNSTEAFVFNLTNGVFSNVSKSNYYCSVPVRRF